MSIQEQLISDIELLPEHTIQVISALVKECLTLSNTQSKETNYVRPAFQFGCLSGVLDIDDDFSDVLADFEEYM